MGLNAARVMVASLLCAAVASGTALGSPSPASAHVVASASAATASAVNDVRVGSFNVSGVNNDKKAGGDREVWRVRRPVVAGQILSRRLDVVGLQEANQSTIYGANVDYGPNQFLDLVGQLNHDGGHWAVTNQSPYNCVRANSSQRCDYQYRGASGDNRIVYNTDTMLLVRQGSYLYQSQTPGKNPRYLAWAVLQSRASGQQFLFTDTHLDPYTVSVRAAEWSEMVAQINSLKGSLPVISVGDLNTSKWAPYAGSYLTEMKAAGFGDVVNQQAGKTGLAAPRALVLRRAWVNSFNGFDRNVRNYSYDDFRSRIGNGIDWVFASNQLYVKKWEVVVNMTAGLQLRGVIPSDHNLVWANVVVG